MKSSNALRRGAAAVAAASVLATSLAAVDLPSPPEAGQQSRFSKLKNSLKRKAEDPAASASEKKAAPAAGGGQKVKKAAPAPAGPETKKSKPVPPEPAKKTDAKKPAVKKTEAAVEVEKKGFIKGLFHKDEKPAASPEPPPQKKASPGKPAVKETEAGVEAEKKGFIKGLFHKDEKPAASPEPLPQKKASPGKPAVKETGAGETAGKAGFFKEWFAPSTGISGESASRNAAPPVEGTPKRSFFGFLRGRSGGGGGPEDSAVPEANRVERPDDWKEYRVVTEDEMAFYEFGPSQPRGPDARLARGSLLKLKKLSKGWALVDTGDRTGYMDASALREAREDDFKAPAPAVPFMAEMNPESWAPLAPPPDLPEQPGAMGGEASPLLLPPLELEPKPGAKSPPKPAPEPVPAPGLTPAPPEPPPVPAPPEVPAPSSAPSLVPVRVPEPAPEPEPVPEPAARP